MLTKTTPITLSGSTREQLVGKSPTAGRIGYVSDDDNSLLVGNGTSSPWEYPTKTKIATMIEVAIEVASDQNLATSKSNLITAPIITGATGALAGQSVTLTASGSQYLWGGMAGITYRWTKNGVTTDAATLSVMAGETVSVIARGDNNSTSPAVNRTIAITTNSPPTTPTAITDLPAVVQRGQSYSVQYTATDADGDAITISYANANGCTISGNSVTIMADATAVSYSVIATDSRGSASAALQISRSGANVTAPPNSTVLTPGDVYAGGIVDPDGMGVTWTTPGTYSFSPPPGVTEYAGVVVGAGGRGGVSDWDNSGGGGGGGGLAWKNRITAASVLVTVGAAADAEGYSGTSIGRGGGGTSSIGTLVSATGGGEGSSPAGYTSSGGTRVGGDGGKSGGNGCGSGNGGGAAGYLSNGDHGYFTTLYTGDGGHGGHRSGSYSTGSSTIMCGGGVGLRGTAPNAYTTNTAVVRGGSGGADATASLGGSCGGGGRGGYVRTVYYINARGGHGGVRILWGSGRSFPSNAGVQ